MDDSYLKFLKNKYEFKGEIQKMGHNTKIVIIFFNKLVLLGDFYI